MKYYTIKPDVWLVHYGKKYSCDHIVYSNCTLYLIGERGLAVIQQRYNPILKSTYWGEIDDWLNDALYLHPNFPEFFNSRAGLPKDGLYPTVSLRQIMWGLKMKPLKRERWETAFDRRLI